MQYILDFATLNCKTTENLKSALSFLSKKASISDNSLKNQFFQKIFSAHQVKKTTHILYTNFPTFTQSERWKFHFHFQIHHYWKYSLISQLQIKLELIFSEEYSTSLFQSFSCQLKTKRLSQIYFYLIKSLICPDSVPLGKSIVSLHQGCKIDPHPPPPPPPPVRAHIRINQWPWLGCFSGQSASLRTKESQLDSWSGHMPGLRVRSPIGGPM